MNKRIIIRRLLLLIIDLLLVNFSLVLTLWFSFDSINLDLLLQYKSLFVSSTLLALVLFLFTGQYKALTTYIGFRFIVNIAIRNILLLTVVSTYLNLINQSISQLNFWLLLWFVLSLNIGTSKILFRQILLSLKKSKKDTPLRVIIYGAGIAGAQLLASLKINPYFSVVAIVDDNKNLMGRYLYGYRIYHSDYIHRFENKIDHILLAIPSLSISSRSKILNKLVEYNVLIIPSINDIQKQNKIGKIEKALRPININDLLGRDSVKMDNKLVINNFTKKVILITGAGGSIGSELAKQLIKLKPKNIVLLEISEASLYCINNELLELNSSVKITPLIGNACNNLFLSNLISKYEVDVIFHAAAYKHVPLLELNSIQGIYNNVFSTLAVCMAAKKLNVSEVTLISSDKAVRPKSVMGATKRISELIFQAYAEENKELKFSIVRFGNVLGSSGSVVPLFERQISQGGPLTLTHKDIVRYFMTISEAVFLVLNTMNLSSQVGDIFILDMGKPVKIYDLAVNMIILRGLSVKDKNNPNGDIEIKITGLRKAEKMYEELAISEKSEKTKHPLIFKAKEDFISGDILFPAINKLKDCIKKDDEVSSIKILKELIRENQLDK